MNAITDLHVSRYATGSAMAAHRHDEAWFCLVLDGSYEERIRGMVNEHAPGDFLFCPAYAEHAQRFGERGARKVLFSPDDAMTAMLCEHGARLDGSPIARRSTAILDLGRRLARELAVDDEFAPLGAQGLAMEIVALTGRGLRDRHASEPAWLRHVRDFLHEDLARDVSLDTLATIAGRHPVHLARTFRTFHGCTLGDYVRRARVERAAYLLRHTRRPLLEIALDCGFAGAAQFSRTFRAVHATTPSAFRQQAR